MKLPLSPLNELFTNHNNLWFSSHIYLTNHRTFLTYTQQNGAKQINIKNLVVVRFKKNCMVYQLK